MIGRITILKGNGKNQPGQFERLMSIRKMAKYVIGMTWKSSEYSLPVDHTSFEPGEYVSSKHVHCINCGILLANGESGIFSLFEKQKGATIAILTVTTLEED